MKTRIYISGPISGYDLDERRKTFRQAANYLSILGLEPVNPFDNGLDQPGVLEQHMRADLQELLSCDCIYMLHGWEKSRGARLELDVAVACGIKVIMGCDIITAFKGDD